jgi:hypothetical protein
MDAESRITSEGAATLPQEVRRAPGADVGDVTITFGKAAARGVSGMELLS